MRVYFKKRDMFMRCPLFRNMDQNRLEFIINNTKPMSMKLSDHLMREGEIVNDLYLVNKGEISLWKKMNREKVPIFGHKKYSSAIKIKDPMDVVANLKKRIVLCNNSGYFSI